MVHMPPSYEIGACPVAEVMGTELFTLSPDTAISSARRLVLENDIDHMLVLDNGTLAGIVCKDDLCDADRNGRVGDCMTSPVVCITPDTTLQEAIDIMGANDIDCLPVVTGTFLVGIVTWQALACAELTPRSFDTPDAAGGADQASGVVEASGDPDQGPKGDTTIPSFSPGPSGLPRSSWETPTEDAVRPLVCAACGGCRADRDVVATVEALGDLPLCQRCRPLRLPRTGDRLPS
jgi:predicted transcriptional regulator